MSLFWIVPLQLRRSQAAGPDLPQSSGTFTVPSWPTVYWSGDVLGVLRRHAR